MNFQRKIVLGASCVVLLLGITLYLCTLIPLDLTSFLYFYSNVYFNDSIMQGMLIFHPFYAFTPHQLAFHLIWLIPLGAAIFIACSFLADQLGHDFLSNRLKVIHRIILILSPSLSLGFLLFLFRGRPITSDETSYKTMATLFSEGRFAAPEWPASDLEPWGIVSLKGITEKYLFGEPIIQIPGLLFDLPALMHIPLAFLTYIFTYFGTKILFSEKAARWSSILMACSPMLIFTTAGGLTHCTNLFCVSMIYYGYAVLYNSIKINKSLRFIVVGSLLFAVGTGWGMCTRPQGAFPPCLAFGVFLIIQALKHRRLSPLLFIALFGSPFCILFCSYNYLLTGSVFKLPWSLWTPIVSYGFGDVYGTGDVIYTPIDSLRNFLVSAVRLNLWWLGWPFSLYIAFKSLRSKYIFKPGMAALIACLGSSILFLAGYFCPGVSDTGPIYYYECLLPLSVLGGVFVSDNLTKKGFALFLSINFILGSIPMVTYQTIRLYKLLEFMHAPADAALAELRNSKTKKLLLAADSMKVGWNELSFPQRYRKTNDQIITFPASLENEQLLRNLYPSRECWRYRQFLDDSHSMLKYELKKCDSSP